MRTNKTVIQWVKHAEEDMRLARHAFKLASAAPYKLIAFHAQQCVEKYLKAFLVLKKVEIPYTHNISFLMELCAPFADYQQTFDDAKSLTFYAVTARYPGKEKVTKQEAVRAVEVADRIRKTVRRRLRNDGVSL